MKLGPAVRPLVLEKIETEPAKVGHMPTGKGLTRMATEYAFIQPNVVIIEFFNLRRRNQIETEQEIVEYIPAGKEWTILSTEYTCIKTNDVIVKIFKLTWK